MITASGPSLPPPPPEAAVIVAIPLAVAVTLVLKLIAVIPAPRKDPLFSISIPEITFERLLPSPLKLVAVITPVTFKLVPVTPTPRYPDTCVETPAVVAKVAMPALIASVARPARTDSVEIPEDVAKVAMPALTASVARPARTDSVEIPEDVENPDLVAKAVSVPVVKLNATISIISSIAAPSSRTMEVPFEAVYWSSASFTPLRNTSTYPSA